MKRRNFLGKVAMLGLLPAGWMACQSSSPGQSKGPYINFKKKYNWKMTTTWPPNFPVLGEGCKMMATWINRMSGDRMKITVYGGGELIPALEGFDAVSNGAVEMNHGAAYYWAGKVPAAQFFAAVPFGMNAQQMGAWILSGGGQQIWESLYAPFNLLPILCGNTGIQMGGWFNKRIDDPSDLNGLKMRIPGLGGKVLNKAGGTSVLVSGGEIYTNLERGVIDATEWIGPYHDYAMGFHEVAKYYYYPGWHEPGAALELLVNKSKFDALPSDLQEIIRTASLRLNRWMGAALDARNGAALKQIREETNVQVLPFPNKVLDALRGFTKEALDELTTRDASSKNVHEAFMLFKKEIGEWMNVSEKIYYEKIMS